MDSLRKVNILGGVVTLGGDVVPATNAIQKQNNMITNKQITVGLVTGYFTAYNDDPEDRTTVSTISWASCGEATCREARDLVQDINTVLEVLGQWTNNNTNTDK
jgi:ribulose bisphosphate carboxylase small subunit